MNHHTTSSTWMRLASTKPHTQMTPLADMDAAHDDITADACRGWIRQDSFHRASQEKIFVVMWMRICDPTDRNVRTCWKTALQFLQHCMYKEIVLCSHFYFCCLNCFEKCTYFFANVEDDLRIATEKNCKWNKSVKSIKFNLRKKRRNYCGCWGS